MPRKSAAASLAVPVVIRHEQPRLPVPKRLSTEAGDVWRAIVGVLPADYFRPEVAPTLERFCVHVARCRRLETLIAEADSALDLDRYERLLKMARAESAHAAALARALRITNQSRHPVTAGKRAAAAEPPRDIRLLLKSHAGD